VFIDIRMTRPFAGKRRRDAGERIAASAQ